MTSLVLGGGEEASVLIEVPVDLLNFGHFPTVHGRCAKTTISRASGVNLDVGLASGCDLVRNVIDFVLKRFALLLFKVSIFIAVEFLPTLGFGGSKDWRLAKNVTIT